MKPAGFFLLIPAGLATVLAAEETPTGLASREIKAHIREGLPTYHPPATIAYVTPGTTGTDAPAADVLVLPKMTVKELRLPSDAADYLMSQRDFKRKMENLYLDELAKDGPLNVLLNNFTLPLISPSKAARGRMIYLAREMDRLQHVIDVSKALDPAVDKKFKRDMDNTNTTRPAGELHGISDLHGGSLP